MQVYNTSASINKLRSSKIFCFLVILSCDKLPPSYRLTTVSMLSPVLVSRLVSMIGEREQERLSVAHSWITSLGLIYASHHSDRNNYFILQVLGPALEILRKLGWLVFSACWSLFNHSLMFSLIENVRNRKCIHILGTPCIYGRGAWLVWFKSTVGPTSIFLIAHIKFASKFAVVVGSLSLAHAVLLAKY